MDKIISVILQEYFFGKKVKLTYRYGGEFVEDKWQYNLSEVKGFCVNFKIDYDDYFPKYLIILDNGKLYTLADYSEKIELI